MLTPRPRRLAALFALAIVALLVVAAWRMRLWPLGPDGAASVGQTTDETGPPSIESAERAALKGRGSDTLPPRVPVSPSRRGPPGLFGVVLSADDDRPIPGARVTATRQDGGARADVETGRDGRFELGPAISSSDAHRLVVAKDGFARFVELRALASVDARMIRLQRGGFIEGRVTEGGRGASFDVVAVRRLFKAGDEVDGILYAAGQSTPDDLHVEARAKGSASEGAFRLGPLTPGDYALVIQAAGRPGWTQMAGAKEWDSSGGIEVLTGKTTDVGTLTLPPMGTVEVRVLDAVTDEPIAGVTFEWEFDLDRHAIRFPLAPSETRADGAYVLPQTLENGSAASTVLVVAKSGFGSAHLNFSGQKSGDRHEVRLARAAAIEGIVQFADGTPMARARVVVLREMDEVACGSAVVDTAGRYAIEPLPADEKLQVVVLDSALGRVVTTAALFLKRGETRRLDLGGTNHTAIEGSVRVAGVGEPRAMVSLDEPNGRRSRFWTAADGRFRFEGLSPGKHALTVAFGEPQTVAETTLDVTEGNASDASVDFAGVIRGDVAKEGEELHAYTRVIARRLASSGAEETWRLESRTGESGKFAQRVVERGVYRLEAADEPYVTPAPVEVDLRALAEVNDIHLKLVKQIRDGLIVIEVKDADTGALLPDAWFRCQHPSFGSTGDSESGVVREEHARPGPYHYTIEDPLHVAAEFTAEITPDVKEIRRTVSMKPSRAVRVTAVNEDGAARAAGVVVGDVLLTYRGARVRNQDELRAAIGGTKPDDRVIIDLLRDGRPLKLTVSGGRMGVGIDNHWIDRD